MKILSQPEAEELRIKALREYSDLIPSPDPVLDSICSLAAEVCGVPIALISLVDTETVFIASRHGSAPSSVPRKDSFCSHALFTNDGLIVEDVLLDQRFANNSLVRAQPPVRFYAGMALRNQDGLGIGTLCVLDYQPHQLTSSQRATLRVLAAQVMSQLDLRRQARNMDEGRRFLSTLVSNLPGMVYRTSSSDDVVMTYVSEGSRELTGYDPDDLENSRNVSFDALIHADDRQRVHEGRQLVFAKRQPCEQEYRIFNSSGELRWVKEWVRGVDSNDGAWLGMEGFIQDITAHKLAHGEITHALSMLRATLESTADGILVVDAAGKIASFNREFARMWRIPDEVLGTGDDQQALDFVLEQLVDPAQFMAKVEYLYRHSAEESFDSLEFRDGRFFERYSRPQIVDGRAIGRVWSFRDVTERKRAALQLEQSEQRLKYALEATEDGLWDWNIPTGDVHYSAQWLRLLGYGKGEIPPRVEPFMTLLHPDDVVPVQQVLDDHLAGRLPVKQCEIRLRTASGEFRWFLDRGQVVVRDATGKPLRMVGTITDITARKQAEVALQESQMRTRLLIKAANVGLWDWDLLTNDVYFSREWKQQLGYAEQELANRYETWETLVHSADLPAALHAVRECIDGHRDVYEAEFRMRHKDGSWRNIYARGEIARDDHDRPVHMMGSHIDITERRRLERSLIQAQKVEALGQLAGGVAHDFNNILAAIIGNVEMAIEDTALDHPSHESLLEIRRAGARAQSLVKQILTFSRQHPSEHRVVSMGPVVEEAVRMLRATIPAQVEMSLEVAQDTPAVLADPNQLHQVVINLCTNAWHALDGKSGRIAISTRPDTLDSARAQVLGLSPGRYARLRVTDTGVGIDASIRLRIFDPFFTTKETGQGTGLGLSVVHGIVHGHGGTIQVDSTPGHGATFSIYLPAAESSRPVEEPTRSSLHQGKSQRILFLDDEAALVTLAKRFLERANYRVDGFTNPVEAWHAFGSSPTQYDLVMTDMNMAGASGLEFASQVKNLRSNIPVVIWTGRMTDALYKAASKAGVSAVLTKPSSFEEVLAVLKRLL